MSTETAEFGDYDENKVVVAQACARGLLTRKRLKRETKRTKLVHEILSTEQTYVDSLRLLVSTYVREVRQSNPPVLDAQSRHALFSSVEEILKINEQLLATLEPRVRDWDPMTSTIGDALQQLIPYLKVYREYCANYNSVIDKLGEKLQNPSSPFAQLMQQVHERNRDERGVNSDLPSLLIMPVQRIPRYKMLFDELVKLTAAGHPDAASLRQCATSIADIASSVNESIRTRENFVKLLQIKRQLSTSLLSNMAIVVPGRRFLREATMLKVCRKGPKRRHFILFSDALIYATPSEVGSSRMLVKPNFLPLNSVQVAEQLQAPSLADPSAADSGDEDGPSSGQLDEATLVEPATTTTFPFVVSSRQKSFVILADSARQRTEWIQALRSAVSDAKRLSIPDNLSASLSSSARESNASLSGAGSERVQDYFDGQEGDHGDFSLSMAPVWVTDQDSKECMACKVLFTFTRRRHHCRACGGVFCSGCSSHRAFLGAFQPGVAGSGDRCCDSCYKKMPARRRRCCGLDGGPIQTHGQTTADQKALSMLRRVVKKGPAVSGASSGRDESTLNPGAEDTEFSVAKMFEEGVTGLGDDSMFSKEVGVDDDDPFAQAPLHTAGGSSDSEEDPFGEPPDQALPPVPAAIKI